MEKKRVTILYLDVLYNAVYRIPLRVRINAIRRGLYVTTNNLNVVFFRLKCFVQKEIIFRFEKYKLFGELTTDFFFLMINYFSPH